MPLLGKKVFFLAKPLINVIPNETIFEIKHTGEKFRSKDEYEKRLQLYSEKIWTCQSTSQMNLTYEAAMRSEQEVYKRLRKEFPIYFEKPVLELIHHSTSSLEQLVEDSYNKLCNQLSVGELVQFKVKNAGNIIQGKILKILPQKLEGNGHCTSPSSDKENASEPVKEEENQISSTTKPPPLSFKYNVQLLDEDKIIASVPADDLGRLESVPSQELLKLFINSHALRFGSHSNSPWVVEEKLINKHNLPNKFAEFFVSPHKMAEMSKNAENKKRKSSSKIYGNESKKVKIDQNHMKPIVRVAYMPETDHKYVKKIISTPIKKINTLGKNKKSNSKHPSEEKKNKLSNLSSSKKSKDSSKKKGEESSKKSQDDSSIKKKKKVQNNNSISKKPKSGESAPKKSKSSEHSKKSKTSSNVSKKKEKSESSKKSKDDSKDKSKKKKVQKSNEKKKTDSKSIMSKKDSSLPKKKPMKQMTLLDMSTKKNKSPHKVKTVPPSKQQPLIVQRIQKALDENRKPAYIQLLAKATRDLSAQQRNALPPHIKQAVLLKLERLEEKKKLKSMTVEEKAAYITNKRLDRLRKSMDERKQRLAKEREMRKELLMRYEDKDLDVKPLPPPKLVHTPEGIPNEEFGNISMITEFLNSYAELLMPEDDFQITSEDLMKNLVAGTEGFMYLNRILVILLQTLLQDQIAEDYKELKIPLSDVPVNFYTASELMRLCLRKHDISDVESTTSSESSIPEEIEDVPETLVSLLETAEFYELEPSQKLELLVGLCHRILSTYSVQDFMEERQQEATKLWKLRIAELKEKNDIKRAEKAKRLEAKKNQQEAKKENVEVPKTEQNDKVGLSVPQFYGKGDKVEKEISIDLELPVDNNEDLASIVKRRRILSVKAQAEREKQEKLERERREKETEEVRKQKQKELFAKQYDEGMQAARVALRHSPIGTDRNHNRYWLFSRTVPGLYVEKGWANKDIDYKIELGAEDKAFKSEPIEVSSGSDSDSDSDNEEESQSPSNKNNIETSIPAYSQNLWFVYDEVNEIDNLMECLAQQGIRESHLKEQLNKHYPAISKAIAAYVKVTPLEKVSGYDELLKVFKQELMETETRLCKGGLGGVPNFDNWQKKLNAATDLRDLGNCMLETQKNVGTRFLQGTLAPRKVKIRIESMENNGEIEKEFEEEMQSEVLGKWYEAVETAPTLSRLHVLLGMLDASIKWEKSAENAKCKICRKKDDDNKLLLCDDCNQAFHLYCLRPALTAMPKGDWLCPACQPASAKRTSRTRNYKESETSEEEEEEDEEELEEEEGEVHNELECSRCGGDEGLVFCSKCPAAYHKDCHIPALRNTPRSTWRCCDCVAGRTSKAEKRKTNKPQKKKRPYRKESKSDSRRCDNESRSKISKHLVFNDETKINTRRQAEINESCIATSHSSRKRGAVSEVTESKKPFVDIKIKVENETLLSSQNTTIPEKNCKSLTAISEHSWIKSEPSVDVVDNLFEKFSNKSLQSSLASHAETSTLPVLASSTKLSQSYLSKSYKIEPVDRTVLPGRSIPTLNLAVVTKSPSTHVKVESPINTFSSAASLKLVPPPGAENINSPNKIVVSFSPNKVTHPPVKFYSSLNKSTTPQVSNKSLPNKREHYAIGQTLLTSHLSPVEKLVPLISSSKAMHGSNRQLSINTADNQVCEEILQKLMRSRFSWPFRVPVDKKQYPDYLDVIENPLDFHVIKNKCLCKEYNSSAEFIDDVHLVLNNARRYPKFQSHAEIQECILKVEEQLNDLLSKHLSENPSNNWNDHAYSNTKRKQ